jgi:glycosyltransferase involved in cell wall biosynthesis
MHLSVIIPAYNGGQRIGKTLVVIHAYLRQPYPAEIVAVDDGPDRGSGETGGRAA